MISTLNLSLLLLLLVHIAHATLVDHADRLMVHDRLLLQAKMDEPTKGVDNCENKCEKAYNRWAYQISTQGVETFEFRACVRGCTKCMQDIEEDAHPGSCFRMCKNFDWGSLGITKGVIEPDKACMGGCVIQTCQVICRGGTPEAETSGTRHNFWPNGGCAIKTEPYSQNEQYVPWNSPNNGQAGNDDVAQCCANALSLCEYYGNRNSVNYRLLVQTTRRSCMNFVNDPTVANMCAFFERQENCGSTAT